MNSIEITLTLILAMLVGILLGLIVSDRQHKREMWELHILLQNTSDSIKQLTRSLK